MKSHLEKIGETMFRALDNLEELGAVGGTSTGGPTRLATGPGAGAHDIALDFSIDPNL